MDIQTRHFMLKDNYGNLNHRLHDFRDSFADASNCLILWVDLLKNRIDNVYTK